MNRVRYSLSVYPRVCGGTITLARLRASVAGLSPRVRGNRNRPVIRHPSGGSIPACAGEPLPGRPANPTGMVYPRVCGGT